MSDPRAELRAAYDRYIEQEREYIASAKAEIERQKRIIEAANTKVEKYARERDAL